MDVLRDILLVAHLVGLAAILGPFLAQLGAKAKSVTTPMVWGARAQIVTGLALAAIVSMGDGDPNHIKIGVKLVIALAIAGLVEVGKKRDSARIFWLLAGLLTIANIIVAVMWR